MDESLRFLQETAPELGTWITPEPEAGITPPENLFDANGMPLPYIQDAGGPRTFRSTNGQAYAPTAPVQGTSAPTPAPLTPTGQAPTIARPSNHVQIPMLLRGEPGGPSQATAGLDMPASAYPDDGTGPQNLLPPPGRPMGTRAVLPIPPAPTNRVSVPSEAQERVTGASNMQRSIEDTVARQAMSDRTMQATRNTRGQSTTPTPQTQGPVSRNANPHPMDTRMQDVFRNPGATLRDLLEASGVTFDWAGFRQAPRPQETPVVDGRADTATVQRTSTNPRTIQWNGGITEVGSDQQDGRAEEVAAMLRARGIRVTSVTRQGNARPHGHPAGNSIDVDPNDQRAAQELIHTYFPGLAVELIPVDAGQDFGNGVRSTGEHGHFDLGSAAGPRRRR